MLLRRVVKGFLMGSALAWLAVSGAAVASEYHGQVTFGGLPVPGSTVTVTATQGEKKAVAVSDVQGVFSFADLADGKWTLEIVMTGFSPVKQEVTVAPSAAAGAFELKLLSIDQIRAEVKPVKVDPAVGMAAPVVLAQTPADAAGKGAQAPGKSAAGAKGAAGGAPEAPAVQDATAQQANDGVLINGSVNNAATSQFSQNQAFGNTRKGRSVYYGSLTLKLDNSALDAQQYSVTGTPSAKPQFNNFNTGFYVAGPLKIKRLLPRGPDFALGYWRTENSTVTTQPALIPIGKDAAGNWDLSRQQNGAAIYVPSTGLSAACLASAGVAGGSTFANNIIPAACVSPAATVLLDLYPQQPNLAGSGQYNYQLPLTNSYQSDYATLTMNKSIGNKNHLRGSFTFADSTGYNNSIFGFVDTSTSLNITAGLNYYRRFTQRSGGYVAYNFNRTRNGGVPNFANKKDIEGTAGISGGSTDPRYWGPPSLYFSSSITALNDGVSSYNRTETNNLAVGMDWQHLRHNIAFGGDFRRQEYNYLTQSNPYGSMGFSGAATRSSTGVGGSDLADLLLGLPDTSSIAYGNPDKYLRESSYDLFFRDDFRVNPEFSMNIGLRWEYGSPVNELKGRLVNLDITPDFSQATAVLGSDPTGALTGQRYPSSLVHPDYSRPEPRIGIAWRPISGSSLLIRSGYDVTNDTSVYQSAAYEMTQQHGTAQTPLSTSVNLANSPACRFTIANPFFAPACSTTSPDTIAIDPHFKVGYVQTWNLAVQRDLPFSLQMVATYIGIKGTHGVQEFLPNTCPPPASGVSTPCSTALSGYLYRTSGGNLTREAGSFELRRRLRNGFTSRLLYTYAKMLDDDYSLSGQGSVTNGSTAQDWRNLAGQRGLSTTDQRHVLVFSAQYTTGMGLGGKSLMSGWKGAIYKEWTILASLNAASGLPETPIYAGATASGAGVGGTIRPDLVGSPYANLRPGYYLNTAAYAVPAGGQWGNARRDSIEGPNQLGLNATMNRTFRLHDRYSLDALLTATNVLNHVVLTGYNTTWTPAPTACVGASCPVVDPTILTNRIFGAPLGANQMRSVSTQLTLRF